MNVPYREQEHNDADEPVPESAGVGSASTLEMTAAQKKRAARKRKRKIGFQLPKEG